MVVTKEKIVKTSEKRIWEIDLIRGILVVMMLLDHTAWWFYRYIYLQEISGIDFNNTLYHFSVWCKQLQLDSPLRDGIRIINVCLFFLISGISTTFSKKMNFRLIVMWGYPILMFLADIITIKTIKYPVMSSYGFFFCFALCSTLYCIFRKLTLKQYLLVCVVIVVIGVIILILIPDLTSSPIRWMGLPQKLKTGQRDDFPIFPFLMCFIGGTLLGKTIYKNKKSILPSFLLIKDIVVQFCGRHSFLIFIAHCIILPVIFVSWALIVN